MAFNSEETRLAYRIPLLLLFFLLVATQLSAQLVKSAETDSIMRDGQTRQRGDQEIQAWSSTQGGWIGIEQFWEQHARDQGGLRWGHRSTYPRYEDVKERDLMIIRLPSGPCLMEFWHGRWRRAQDVRRWSPAFNSYGGCAEVFD